MSMTRIMEWYIKKLANAKNELVHLFLIVQLQFVVVLFRLWNIWYALIESSSLFIRILKFLGSLDFNNSTALKFLRP